MMGVTSAEVSLGNTAAVPSDADFIWSGISAGIVSMVTPGMVD